MNQVKFCGTCGQIPETRSCQNPFCPMQSQLTAGELFSGCGGFSLGFEEVGIETKWHCEIDPDARDVLQRHWPEIPCYDDVTALSGYELEPVDVITFGSPCQDLSIAGNRHGLDGKRSNLFFEACRVIEEMRDATEFRYPRYAIWENVSGALSSKGGADFARALDELAGLGAVVVEWNVLNARYFGVPQRRRRVFVVACFDPRAERIEEVLPVATSLRGDLDARIKAEQRATKAAGGGPLAASGVVQALTQGLGTGGPDAQHAQAGWLLPDTVPALTSPVNGPRFDDQESQQLVVAGLSENQRGELFLNPDHVRALANKGGKPGQGYAAIAYSIYPESGQGADLRATEATCAPTISVTDGEKMTDRGIRVVQPVHAEEAGASEEVQVLRDDHGSQEVPGRETRGPDGVPDEEVLRPGVHALGVRRLLPIECERLQGWPDDHTAFRPDGSPIADSARYRLIGNGVVANVTAWIGKQLLRVEEEL